MADAGIVCILPGREPEPCPEATAIDDGHGDWAVLSCTRNRHEDPLHYDSLACEGGLWWARGADPRSVPLPDGARG